MLCHHYINYYRELRVRDVVLSISLTLLLVSCSSVNNVSSTKDNSQTKSSNEVKDGIVKSNTVNELKILSKELVDLVDTQSLASINRVSIQAKSVKKVPVESDQDINAYLAQKMQLMANVPENIIIIYQQALAAMDKKQWQLANDLFDQVSSEQPHLSGAYVNKALIVMTQNKMILAQFQIDKALKVNPVNPYAHNIQGQLARLRGDFIQAEQSYLAALAIWPSYAEVHWNLAVLLELYRGRYLAAKSYYISFQQLAPDDKQVRRSIAGLDIKIARAETLNHE